MIRTMSGHTLLKVSYIYSMFSKVTYSISKPKIGHIREAITKYNQSNFGHFPTEFIKARILGSRIPDKCWEESGHF